MNKYSEYKDSGVEWLGEVPKHWEIVRLKYKLGLITEKAENANLKKIGLENIVSNKGVFIETETDFAGEGVSFKKDDILFGKLRPYLAKVLVAPFEGNAVGDFFVYRTKDQDSPRFYFYRFLSDCYINVINGSTFGAKMPRASSEFIANLPLPYPELPEQKKIANYLDQKTSQTDSLIANKKRMIDLLKEERAAIINHAVTKGINPDAEMKDSGVEWLGEVPKHWKIVRLKYKLGLITEKAEKANLKKIGLENIVSNKGVFIETETDFAGEGVSFKKDDILFGKLRPYLAKVLVAPFEGNAVGDFFVYRTKDQDSPRFYFYRFLSDCYINVINGSTFGAKMPRASSEFIANLPLPYPELPEQKKIANYLDQKTSQIDFSITHIEKEIALIEEYRTALINETVTGKIDIRDKVKS